MKEIESGSIPLNPNKIMEDTMKEVREEIEKEIKAPPGYIAFSPSTKGLIGCPKTIHIRNFTTEDLLYLGLSDTEDLPIRIIKMFDSIIYEDDVSIEQFHEKEVMELALFIYESYYTDSFPDLDWELTEEDWDFIANKHGGRKTAEFLEEEAAIKEGDVKFKFDLSLIDGVKYHDIDPNIKTKAKITKDDGFSFTFGPPKYGDVAVLKKFIERVYADEDRRFSSLGETIKLRREAEESIKNGKYVDMKRLPNIPKAQLNEYKEYELQKGIFSMTAIKALYLLEFNGEDVSRQPLEKKIELMRDPRIDHSSFSMIEEYFKNLEFGLKEEITAYDPVLGKVVDRKYSFRLFDILQACRDQKPSNATISFE